MTKITSAKTSSHRWFRLRSCSHAGSLLLGQLQVPGWWFLKKENKMIMKWQVSWYTVTQVPRFFLIWARESLKNSYVFICNIWLKVHLFSERFHGQEKNARLWRDNVEQLLVVVTLLPGDQDQHQLQLQLQYRHQHLTAPISSQTK